jgi:large-conductance mechanosensitive channel
MRQRVSIQDGGCRLGGDEAVARQASDSREPEAAPAESSDEVRLLTEIRDELRKS